MKLYYTKIEPNESVIKILGKEWELLEKVVDTYSWIAEVIKWGKISEPKIKKIEFSDYTVYVSKERFSIVIERYGEYFVKKAIEISIPEELDDLIDV